MKILIIPSWYPNLNNNLSGIFFKEQAEGLAKHDNISVHLIAINESSFRWIFNKNKTIFNYHESNVKNVYTISIIYPIFDRFEKLTKTVRLFVFKFLFTQYIKKFGKPDIVHLHSFMHGHLALWIKNKYGINYLITEHSTGFVSEIYNKEQLSYAKQIFLEANYRLSVSNEFSKLLKQKFNMKFNYLPNSVDTEFFNLRNIKKEKEDFNFINIAFLDKKKNHDLLIESFTELFFNNKNIKLLIVGDGPEYENLKNLIYKLNIENQIKLYGRANREEIKRLLSKSDAFVLSSKYETFGVVIIEAMACGLPVLSTKSGGPESIITNNELGLLVDNDDKDSFKNGLKKIYEEKYDKEYIREYVENNFSYKAVSSKLINIYKKILNNKF